MTGDTAFPNADLPGQGRATGQGSWREFWRTPWRMRLFLLTAAVAALSLPFLVERVEPPPGEHLGTVPPHWLTVVVLVLISVLNVEIGRAMTGGLARSHQPHKALSAWAFACALLLPASWLLVVVPVTYAHTRWRALRLPLWKWVGSAIYLVLAGVAAFVVRVALFGHVGNWMVGDGGRGVLAMAAAAAAFLACETLLFWGSALLNDAEDEVWLRQTLRSPGFYGTEAAVVLVGGLLAAVWTGGPWYVLLSIPVYVLVQRAALLEPLRERAQVAGELAAKNRELERANQFKADLMGMLGHEIGNPLTAALGYAQIGSEALAQGDLDTARTAFGVLERSTAEIRRVVNEILNLVSSDHDALTAHPERCPLEPHLRAAVATQRPGHQPSVECPSGLAALVQPGHLDQILANLLSNASKYAGGATRISAGTTDTGHVEIAVSDAGAGVAPEFRARLFDRFSRSPETADAVTGSGLGLYITRELARANGGDVVLCERPPPGSTFVVRLPGAD
ncbi:MAG TPA: HAMP domain-containing sensor histidine kinase [Marmoricola sp.]